MTNEERVQNLQSFGYSETEARFLCLAALHSGYFLRRQFISFSGAVRGRVPANLIAKLLDKGHVKALCYRYGRIVYHLSSKPIYEALGQADNRHRRQRPVFSIKNKLMTLDFVLRHPDHTYLATEREKLQYFLGQLKLDPEVLPRANYRSREKSTITARYFVDKFPIFLSAAPEIGAPPVVSFCYIDEGLQSFSGFEYYLRQYWQLFAALTRFQVVYVALSKWPFGRAERMFQKMVVGSGAESTNRLLNHFRERDSFERKNMTALTQEVLIRLRSELKEFSGSKYNELFSVWKRGRDAEVQTAMSPRKGNVASFSSVVLEGDYDLFGTLGKTA